MKPQQLFRMQNVTPHDYMHKILPLGFCSAATLALGNVAYLYLDVGLLQMLKSCCPVFVMLVAIAFRLERFSFPLVASIAFIALGTATTAATGDPLSSTLSRAPGCQLLCSNSAMFADAPQHVLLAEWVAAQALLSCECSIVTSAWVPSAAMEGI